MKCVVNLPIDVILELAEKHGVKGLELVTMGTETCLQYEDKTRYTKRPSY